MAVSPQIHLVQLQESSRLNNASVVQRPSLKSFQNCVWATVKSKRKPYQLMAQHDDFYHKRKDWDHRKEECGQRKTQSKQAEHAVAPCPAFEIRGVIMYASKSFGSPPLLLAGAHTVSLLIWQASLSEIPTFSTFRHHQHPCVSIVAEVSTLQLHALLSGRLTEEILTQSPRPSFEV